MVDFTPTFLYIKQHKKTGKLYFGKTIQDPLKYNGSGTQWLNHINYHGISDVDTVWYCLFTDNKTIGEFAMMCSKMWNIVEDQSWANLMAECGSGDLYKSELTRKKLRDAALNKSSGFKGKTHSDEAKRKNREAHLGKKHNAEAKAKIKLHNGVRGRSRTKDEIERISAALTGVSHDAARVEKMKKTKLNSRKKWYSNDMETKLFDANSVPDGWVPGRKITKEINNV